MNSLIPSVEEMKQIIMESVKEKSIEELQLIIQSFKEQDYKSCKLALKEIQQYQKQETERVAKITKEQIEQRLKNTFENIDQKVLNSVYAASQIYNEPLKACVYFIQNELTGQIKIGMASDIEKRFKQIKTAFSHIGMPAKLKLIAVIMTYPQYIKKIENEMHQLYAIKRICGEWFDVSVDEIQRDLLMTDSVEYIDDVLVNYMDYEAYHLENISKNYNIPLETLLDEKFDGDVLRFLITGKYSQTNKLKLIDDIVSHHGVGFYEASPVLENNEVKIYAQGIKSTISDTMYSIQDIKIEALNKEYLSKIFKRIA